MDGIFACMHLQVCGVVASLVHAQASLDEVSTSTLLDLCYSRLKAFPFPQLAFLALSLQQLRAHVPRSFQQRLLQRLVARVGEADTQGLVTLMTLLGRQLESNEHVLQQEQPKATGNAKATGQQAARDGQQGVMQHTPSHASAYSSSSPSITSSSPIGPTSTHRSVSSSTLPITAQRTMPQVLLGERGDAQLAAMGLPTRGQMDRVLRQVTMAGRRKLRRPVSGGGPAQPALQSPVTAASSSSSRSSTWSRSAGVQSAAVAGTGAASADSGPGPASSRGSSSRGSSSSSSKLPVGSSSSIRLPFGRSKPSLAMVDVLAVMRAMQHLRPLARRVSGVVCSMHARMVYVDNDWVWFYSACAHRHCY